MEEPSVEWKNREYTSDEGSSGKMNWIWNKGLGFGKKILVGGAVVSSAPLLFPPLVVISVLGVALSVPYGILLGSYACTEKLMSKLLPPPAPPLSGYGTITFGDEMGDADYGGLVNMEKEETKLMVDVKAGVEMRIELADKENEELGGGTGKVPEEYGHEQVGNFSGAEQGPEEIVYEEHKAEYCDEEENMLVEVIEKFEAMREGDVEEFLTEIRDEEPLNEVEGIAVVIEGNGLVGDKDVEATNILGERPIDEVEGVAIVIEGEGFERSNGEEAEIQRQVTTILVEECRNQERTSDIEEDELVRGTRGLLEKIRDEGGEDTREELRGGAGVVDQDAYRSIEEMEMPNEAKGAYINSNDRMKKPIAEIKEMSAEDVIGHKEKREPGYVETVKTAREEVNEDVDQKTIAEMETPIEAKSAYNTNQVMMDKPTKEIEERSPVEILVENEEETREASYVETVETVREEVNRTEVMGHSVVEEEAKLLLKEEITLKRGRADSDSASDETENIQLKAKIGTVAYSNANARDIADESGVGLFDDKNAAGQEYNFSDYDTPEESEHSSWDMRSGSGNSLEPPVSTRVSVAESESQICFRKDMNSPSNEIPYNEEKIWEQIRAMRTIVGYKAATHATCIEELKALYMFTGIEPPASLRDSLDPVEVNEKLQFLMSIIGVK